MRERDPQKMKKYISGIYSMLEELEECLDEMGSSYGERDDYERDGYGDRDYGYGERHRSARTGRYVRG